jgi:hypothetical protein
MIVSSAARVLTSVAPMFIVATVCAAPKAPPLIVVPDTASYTFNVPDGWDFSFDEPVGERIRVVFFTQGGGFHASSTIVYAVELCKRECGDSFDDALRQTIENAREHSPALEVLSAAPLPAGPDREAQVRVLSGARDVRQAREALAFIDTPEFVVLVVLTTQNVSSWDDDYAALSNIVAGFQYFDCNSPNLRVPCDR